MTDGRLSVDAGNLHVDANGRVYYNAAPVSDIAASNTSPTAGDSITLYDQASDPNGDLESWSWDFDDGSSASGSGDKSHTYSSSGTYHPTLTVADVFGISDSDQVQIDVQSAVNFVDNFEDGDLSEYAGATGSFTVQSSTVWDGSWALQRDSGSSAASIVSQSGLDNYPQQGEEFGWFVYIPSSSNASASGFLSHATWAQQSNDGSNTNGYGTQKRTGEDVWNLGRIGTSTFNNINSTTVDWSNYEDQWLEERFTWDSSGNMTAELYDGAKDNGATQIASISYSNTAHSSGGISFRCYDTIYYDNYRIVGSV